MANEPSTNTLAGKLQIEVFGTELGGCQFVERARTLTITRDGATIPLTNKLAPDSELIVRNPETNEEAIARVVDLVRDEIFVQVYAIAFIEGCVNLWQVEFPEALPPKMIALECNRCHTVEAVLLNEIETDVFETKQTLTRHCKCSKSSTIWKQTDRPVTERTAPERAMSDRRQEASPVPEPPALKQQDRRSGKRTAMNPRACIRWQGGETLVECEDVSRGGFRFKSQKAYPEGTHVDVAVPYTRSSVNIFVTARIAYAQALAGGLYRYGVAYVKAIQKHDSKY
jgi:hypothetical protein